MFSIVSPERRIRDHQVSVCLREPLRVTRACLRSNARQMARLSVFRSREQSPRRMRRHSAGIAIPRLALFEALNHEDRRSRIIASFHYGDYVFGLNSLMAAEPGSRRRFVVTLQAGSTAYFLNLSRAFGKRAAGPESELLLAGLSMTRIARMLRGGCTSLVLFCDLPPAYGAKLEVEFLGRRATFGRGAATLAVAHRVPILPVICHTRSNETVVSVEAQLEPVLQAGESRTEAILRLTDTLIRLLEFHVARDPSQWRYLSLLPAYVQLPETSRVEP